MWVFGEFESRFCDKRVQFVYFGWVFDGKEESDDPFHFGIQGRGVSGALLVVTFSVLYEIDIFTRTT